jgi:hypothetical protein
MIVLAQLDALATTGQPEEQSQREIRLVKSLYERGVSLSDVLELFRLVDWLMALPEPLDEQFSAEMDDFEERQRMPYLTSVERIGIRKGVEIDREEGREGGREIESREMALGVLTRRFEELPAQLAERVKIADADWCRTIVERAFDVEDAEELLN